MGASGALALLGRLGRSLLRKAPRPPCSQPPAPGTAVGEGRAVGRSLAQSLPWVEGMALMARGQTVNGHRRPPFPLVVGGRAEVATERQTDTDGRDRQGG